MNTPIADFVKNYIKSGFLRFHMPGHKGMKILGIEKFDITEISGADVLSDASGIISESEKNASALFNTGATFYATEGSTAAIYAMLSLVKKEGEGRQVILAARNVHKAFVQGCALCDFDVNWLMPLQNLSILKCEITAEVVEQEIIDSDKKPAAVYITSPDYLGNTLDIAEISKVCKKYDVPLLVDNAHGAYLGFLKESMHPIHLGATVCCDSAHKTLPVLTGGAYLHISKDAPSEFAQKAKSKLALFTSTSPSYIILQSLDLCNKYLADRFEEKLEKCVDNVKTVKRYIEEKGFCVLKSEPMKIVIDAKKSGFLGKDIAGILRNNKIEPEFYDDDFVVLMVTPQNKRKDFKRLKKIFKHLKPKGKLECEQIVMPVPQLKMTIRGAVFADFEEIDVKSAEGRICAMPSVSCPPAVPIAVSGEVITREIIKLFEKYDIEKIKVVKGTR